MNDLQELIGNPEKEKALIHYETEIEEMKLLAEFNKETCSACGRVYEGEKCPNGCQDTNRSGILII